MFSAEGICEASAEGQINLIIHCTNVTEEASKGEMTSNNVMNLTIEGS